MPFRPRLEEQLDPAPEHPVTPTKPTRNDAASHFDLDTEVLETDSERDEELGAKKIKLPRHVLKYVVVKRCVTGERAAMDKDQIRSELDAKMRELIELSGQQKFCGHKSLSTYRGFWKLGRSHKDRCSIIYDVYRCPMGLVCRARSGAKLLPVLIFLSSSDTGFMISTVMTMMAP